ncbi:hypothetical protein [Paenibacillus beijingensis]|uniref:hypothetical protein n=1 Tax=Paenibacillus beijingensis TaxID=1126833 RepID=UPI000AFE48B1|nr:hypothetical protein [Paenibacillus beijingensis]
MKQRIGIVGCGAAGIQLAYSLKNDFDLTIMHDQEADDIRFGKIRSTQVHFSPARSRERQLHMPVQDGAPSIRHIHLSIGNQKLFAGKLADAASSVDQRMAFSRAMNDLERQGVQFRKAKVYRDNIGSLA